MKKISQKKKDEALDLLGNRHLIPIQNSYLDGFMSDKEVFEALLIMGADPNYVEPYFKVPILSLAHSRNYYHAFKTLLEHGANPNVVSSVDSAKTNIVFEIILYYTSNLRYLKLMLKHQVDLNVNHPKTMDRLLTWILKTGRVSQEQIQLMLENGCDPNQKNGDGSTIFNLIDNDQIKLNETIISLLNKYKT
jgi:ankyrin repeat protein